MTNLKEQRKIEIIKSAMQVFGEHGYYRGKVEEIAINAGIGKGTVYEYFQSKKEIFQEMLQYMFDSYIEAAIKSTSNQTTVRDKLIALLDFHWNFISTHADVIEQSFFRFENISESIRPHIFKVHRRIFKFILNIVVEGIEKGEINPEVDKEMASIVLLSTISGSNIKRIVSDEDFIDSGTIIDMIFEGIGVTKN